MSRVEFEIAVKTAMIRKSLNLSKTSKIMGISAAYLSDIIRGNRKANFQKKKLCEILDIKFEEKK